jgi:MerR family transcriptional regulator, mercuric resistance operon regulatory protein
MAADSSEQLMRISELAERCGVSRQTIQYYLLLGLIQEAGRSAGGQRLFDHKCVRRVKLINKINRTGYPLCEIRRMFLKKK